MNCTICGKPIVLVPSAEERARTSGETTQYYRRLFTEHSSCAIAKRNKEAYELMKKITEES